MVAGEGFGILPGDFEVEEPEEIPLVRKNSTHAPVNAACEIAELQPHAEDNHLLFYH